jgi:ribosomal protein S18 acetylase RimI-like enzyme
MQIREMKKSDMPQLAVLYAQFWNSASDVSRMENNFDIIARKNTHILLCVTENDKLIGSVMGIVCKELFRDCHPFLVIENMIIDKTARKKGIGTALLAELEKKAKTHNCAQIILVTEDDRLDACHFYEKNGFQLNNKGYEKKL